MPYAEKPVERDPSHRRSLLAAALRVVPPAVIMVFVIWFYSIDKPSKRQPPVAQDPEVVRALEERATAAQQSFTGIGMPRDFKKARELYVEIARQEPSGGHRYEDIVMARRALGEMHAKGLGVPVDWDRAIDYYEQAARLGDSESMIFVAEAYEAGTVIHKDLVAAYSWYSKAASTFEYPAVYEVGKTFSALNRRLTLERKRHEIASQLDAAELRRALAM
jgi:TPR repeat protein